MIVIIMTLSSFFLYFVEEGRIYTQIMEISVKNRDRAEKGRVCMVGCGCDLSPGDGEISDVYVF